MNNKFQDNLLKTFEAMYLTGGPGSYINGSKASYEAIEHREKETEVRQFLRDWTNSTYHYDRCFYPFNDPREVPEEEKILLPPLDAASDDWTLAIEIKYSSATPVQLNERTGGFWIPIRNYDHMKRFCGIDFKNARPFENGWFIYHFSTGEVYALSIKKFHYLVLRKCEKIVEPKDVGGEPNLPYIDPIKANADKWVVPMGLWTLLGNIREKRYYKATSYNPADPKLKRCI